MGKSKEVTLEVTSAMIATYLDIWIEDDNGVRITDGKIVRGTIIRVYAALKRVDNNDRVGGKVVWLHTTKPNGTTDSHVMPESSVAGHYLWRYAHGELAPYGVYRYVAEFLGDSTHSGCEAKVG